MASFVVEIILARDKHLCRHQDFEFYVGVFQPARYEWSSCCFVDAVRYLTDFQCGTKKLNVSMLPFCAEWRVHYDGVEEASYNLDIAYYPVDFQLHSLTIGDCGMY
jgi:hypothetical protein